MRHTVVILEDTARSHFQTDPGLCYILCIVTYYIFISVGFAEHMLRKYCEPGLIRKPNPEDILHHFHSFLTAKNLAFNGPSSFLISNSQTTVSHSCLPLPVIWEVMWHWTVNILNLYVLEQKRKSTVALCPNQP